MSEVGFNLFALADERHGSRYLSSGLRNLEIGDAILVFGFGSELRRVRCAGEFEIGDFLDGRIRGYGEPDTEQPGPRRHVGNDADVLDGKLAGFRRLEEFGCNGLLRHHIASAGRYSERSQQASQDINAVGFHIRFGLCARRGRPEPNWDQAVSKIAIKP